jgi:hypothetical protein
MKNKIKIFKTPLLLNDKSFEESLDELEDEINEFTNNNKILKFITNVQSNELQIRYIITILYEEK